MKKQFARYAALNILGMVGLSLYIIADSYFISKAQGADGLTALNLALPLYNLIFAIGSMTGTGSAIRYIIAKSRKFKDAENYIFNSVFFSICIGILFSIAGIFFPDKIMSLLGADKSILNIGTSYTRIFMSCSPFFMLNYTANAFVRNDGAPKTAMAATLISSLFNIIFDYILMFPLNMGMNGAALATGISPVLGILICASHLFSEKCTLKIKPCIPSFKKLFSSWQVGISAFVAEISSGVITMTFNFIILGIAGNTGVAAYGIIANIALVATAFFNGIAQGSQPLISKSFGLKKHSDVLLLRNLSFITSFVTAVIIYIILAVFAPQITTVFNHEENPQLTAYAVSGIKLYFTGLLFSGINITGSSFFSAAENVKAAFNISVLRGFVFILLFAFILSWLFKMNGVWLSYTSSELAASLVMFYYIKKSSHQEIS